MSRKGLVSLIVLGLCVSALYETTNVPLPPELEKGGSFQFLTVLSLVVTIIYITLSQITSSNWNVKYIYPLASNLEFQVTVGYWSLKLLGFKNYERSLWLDIKLHAIPYLYLLVLDSHSRGSVRTSVMITVAFMLVWWTYIESIVYLNRNDGVTSFPYGMLNNRTFIGRFVWFIGFTSLSCLNYVVLGIRNCF
ncbi:uncharacterized protein SPAPADRAFT_58407 [Spathaspora passalidarum NRRL Y-27907]|uniref:FAR-17a/AIG1-like protein n=1 Tax=Spathaspora passalidarum (strain NRRL Y-27907 / 11-Y1) TaxID=619300 RepID=G3AG68_SPAPN|nr:uncharacterized protein SPAPADRAFT_58407 [Spathaspora passalidarum NRRL Y-27907]EGW35207.1 hypothetical protein SPAPADRAFT_58407 [Spathaspora passalidarum NRRL Y-27907]